MADIFISYSSEDKSIVEVIAALLENRGWTVWWDRQIPIGQRFDNVIEKELHKANCVLVIWTKKSVASEWVKNEANDAAQRGVLVPVLVEPVTIPLAFRRIETAILTNWKGENENPELALLFNAIATILQPKEDATTIIETKADETPEQSSEYSEPRFQSESAFTKRVARILVYSLLVTACIVTGLLLYNHFLAEPYEKNLMVRIFDWKKNPVTQGDVKIYLDEYVRTQSLDKTGQALFNGIPSAMMKNKMKIEVSSPGYTTKTFDTLLVTAKPLELTLPLSTVVFIRGKVKTAAEVPIKGVEINVDGTRYYAISITDGSYNLRLDEYTLGDEITLTTSHKQFEDKTISLTINSPDITNKDIFLNPIAQ